MVHVVKLEDGSERQNCVKVATGLVARRSIHGDGRNMSACYKTRVHRVKRTASGT
jgi:hypothetical protein